MLTIEFTEEERWALADLAREYVRTQRYPLAPPLAPNDKLPSTISDTSTVTDIHQHATSTTGTTLASTPVSIPEPASLVLLGTALAGLGLVRRRRRNA